MKITTLTVEIHEKRAHPSERGHYDSRVSLTAWIDDGENYENVALDLKNKAGAMVTSECDSWVSKILTRGKHDTARIDLEWICDQLRNRLPTDTDVEQFERHLAVLLDFEHPQWHAKLKAAQAEYLTSSRRILKKIVDNAGQRELFLHEKQVFAELVAQLPEDERQGYIDKMSDAQ